MSYIGNPIVSTDFPKDTFSGNGSTTAFTMQIAPASVNAVIVVVSGITQDPSTYTISGTTLTFSAAPPTGTSNISVRHLGVAGTPNVPATGSVTSSSLASGNYFSQWTTSGSDIYYNTGNVGVGTASPDSKLHISSAGVGAVRFLYNGLSENYFDADSNIFRNKSNTEVMRTTSTGLFQFNSGYGSVATAYGCRAWVNFNGTGTVAIRASGNVSSITDNGTGNYTINFTNAFPDANYAVVGFASYAANAAPAAIVSAGSDYAPATTSCRLKCGNSTNGGTEDTIYFNAAFFR